MFFEQRFDRPGRQFGEGGIVRGKPVVRTLAFQRLNETGGFYGRNQRVERPRGDCRIDDISGPREGRVDQRSHQREHRRPVIEFQNARFLQLV